MATSPAPPSILPSQSTDKTIHSYLCVVAPIFGLMIPGFYDWTGMDQSRPSPWALYALIAIVGAVFILWGWLIVCHVANRGSFSLPLSSSQWSIKHLLVTMLVVAIYLAVWTAHSLLASAMLIGGVLFFSWWTIARIHNMRWPMSALLASAYLPYLWVVGRGSIKSELLFLSPALPATIPCGLISSLTRQHFGQLVWLGLLLTALELVAGILLIRAGAKLGVAYNLLVLALSIVGSFALNAMVRA